MSNLNSLKTILTRYIFQFLEVKEIITIGYMSERLRNIFNLRKEYMKLFLFTLNIDYNMKLLENIHKYINFIEKKFPKIEDKIIIDFMVFYIKFSTNSKILYPDDFNYKDTCLILNLLNSKHSSSYNQCAEEIIFKLKNIYEDELKSNNHDFTYLPLETKNYRQYVDVTSQRTDYINELINFSKLNKNHFKEIRCLFNNNLEILDELFLHNPNAIKILKVSDDGFLDFDFKDLKKFNKLDLSFTVNSPEDILYFKNAILQIKINFIGEFYLGLSVYSNKNFKEISELISINLLNVVSLHIPFFATKNFDYDFDFRHFTNNLLNLRRVRLDVRNTIYSKKQFILEIGKYIHISLPLNKSCLFGAIAIIERNLDNDNEDWFEHFYLSGNVYFIIEFFESVAKQMTAKNFKKLFSKILKFSIVDHEDLPEFELKISTKDNIQKCLRQMINLKTLKIHFSPKLAKYLDLFQFDLLTSLNAFKYSTNSPVNSDTFKQIKNIKIKYISAETIRLFKGVEEITENLSHLVKLKVNLFFGGMEDSGITKKTLTQLFDRNKHLNEVIFQNCKQRDILEILGELKEKYKNITFSIETKRF